MTPEQLTALTDQILRNAVEHIKDHIAVNNPVCHNPAYKENS